MAWFRRRASTRVANAPTQREDYSHLERFAATRAGVEGFLEPRTTVTETTLMLVAGDGEWTRRVVPSVASARSWANRKGIPIYDVMVVGYPARKRAYDERRKRAQA